MSNNETRRREAMQQLERELSARDRKEKSKPLAIVAASLAIILAIVGGIWFANSRTTDETVDAAASSTTASEDADTIAPVLDGKRTTPLPDTVTCAYNQNERPAKDVGLPPTENVSATGTVDITLDTSAGKIPLTLDRAAAPCTVNAITYLASKDYYDDVVCHRLTTSGIKVLQCGDPSGTGAGGPGFTFADEYPVDVVDDQLVTYPRGSVAMANAGPSTNGSQFFLNYGDSPLPPNYTYFGTIADEGLTTLDAIAAKGTADGQSDGAPAEEVKIANVEVAN
ncbi:peptidylprolyl isomerase [Corynebacterium choanae]|uniref:Bifunctional phosphatase/peptidyl-prolyl cis-trans isomerase n=1 Tax=Corynebacterium choanae TaxID=1862358 RepID=A0A3G6J743_9CORY|nr:peptidylprolyl isomerase [Corynebacterium choanae]AZA13689.1 Putative bifunctional phosphatase/peptidyl-prolyl cis-trans isomerase [Corynebacterium choanae]